MGCLQAAFFVFVLRGEHVEAEPSVRIGCSKLL